MQPNLLNWLEWLKYLGVALGAFLEGEIAYLATLQAIAAKQLHWPLALLFFALGTLAADWGFYWIGRRNGQRYLARHPRRQQQAAIAQNWLRRHSTVLLLAYRFIYGFRVVLPVLFGLARIAPWRYVLMTTVATSLWMGIYGALAHYFSQWLGSWLQSGKPLLTVAIGGLILGGAGLLYYFFKPTGIDKKDAGQEQNGRQE